MVVMTMALMAVALTATAAMAQCTAGDIGMTRIFPPGNLTRSTTDIHTNNAIVGFSLPTTCLITDGPVTACVDVWDTGNPGAVPAGFRTWSGWSRGFPPRVCNANFLVDNGQGTDTAVTTINLSIDFAGTTPRRHSEAQRPALSGARA